MQEIDVAYRLYRLRRLIAVAVLPPVAVSLLVFAGPLGWLLAIVSVIGVTAHAVRFPTAWEETLVTSAVVSAGWILLAALGAVTGPVGFFVGVPFVTAVLAFLALSLTSRFATFLSMGPVAPLLVRASRKSTLDPEMLRAGVTLYPGRSDLRTEAGEADETGLFDVRIGHRLPSLFAGDEDFSDIAFRARVEHADAQRHVVTVLGEAGETLSKTCHTFRATKSGAKVTMEEDGAAMPLGARLGFWLQDFGADHLTDEVDRAEGRAERANRFAPRDSLMMLVAARMTGQMTADAQ